jgi:DNA primase
MSPIYELICSNGILSPKHTEELKTKRGFTDATIKRNRFFSGGQYLLFLEKELSDTYKQEELIESGVFTIPKKSKIAQFSTQLLDDRIIIPYLDKEGKCFYIRPHKLGLTGAGIELYQDFNIIHTAEDDKRSGSLIITEGEFKACAAVQMGANCIAVPGISSFTGEHYPRLIEFLSNNQIKQIIIIFDNENKSDPTLKSYKSDVNDRFDTAYYAYVLAKMLNKDGFTTAIGTLPDPWRIDGKADIDGALAHGKTAADLEGVCRRALNPKEYFESLDDEAKEVIKRKEERRYFRTHIRVDFGKYVAKRFNGKKEWDEVISNFTLNIISTHKTAEGNIRELCFVQQGKKGKSFFAISPEDMAGNDGFSTFCFRHGNYIWKGRKEDLYLIWEYEFLNDNSRYIIEPDCIGWLPEDKIWMFGNVAFVDGKELRPDEQGIFWTDKCGYKPSPLGVSSGKNVISEGVPYLTLTKADIVSLRAKLSESIGEFEASVCLGWCFSVFMMEEVFKHYGCFPFLFVTGRRRSGKSTVAEWMMNLFGLENSGKQGGDTTSVAIQRYMSYYSSLPFFVDEYRNDLKVTQKNGLFRNAYNRQSAGKGVKADYGIREAKVRGTLILAGEETPADNALLTRCVVVQVSEVRRRINNFDWFTKNRQKMSTFAYHILSNRANYLEKYMPRLLSDKEEIARMVNDDRMAINMAVVSAGVWSLFGDDKAFAKQFIADIRTVKVDQESENVVSQFFADVKAMAVDPKHRLRDLWDMSDGKIYLYFHAIYNVWASDYQSRHRETPFKSDAIKGYLKDEPGFVEMRARHRMKSGNNRCVVFNFEDSPDFIKDLFDLEDVPADAGTVPSKSSMREQRKDL